MKDKIVKDFIKKLEKLKKAQLAQKKESVGNLFKTDAKLIFKAYEMSNRQKLYPQLLHKQEVLKARLLRLSDTPTTNAGVIANKSATTIALAQKKIVDEIVEKYNILLDIITEDTSSLKNLTEEQILDFAFVTEVTKVLCNMHGTLGYSAYDPLFVLFEQLEAKLENSPMLQNDIHNFVEYLSALAQKEADTWKAYYDEINETITELEEAKGFKTPDLKESKPLPPDTSILDTPVDVQMPPRTSRLDSPPAPSTPEKKTTTKPTPKPEQKTDEKPKASDGDSICLDGLLPNEKPGAIKEL